MLGWFYGFAIRLFFDLVGVLYSDNQLAIDGLKDPRWRRGVLSDTVKAILYQVVKEPFIHSFSRHMLLARRMLSPRLSEKGPRKS